MTKHTQLSLIDFQVAIKETQTFNNFENFKKGIVIKHKNILRLHDYYQQACRNGIDYLRLNPNLSITDIKLILMIKK